MAKSLDQVNLERNVQAKAGAKYPAEDVELATRMGVKLLSEGNGIQLIKDAINKSQDPAQVIGQFLAQMMGQLAEVLQEQYDIDPGIFVAKNGFLDNILNYIEGKLGYPEEFSDQIYGQVLETIKAAASGPPAPNNVMDPQAQRQEQETAEMQQRHAEESGGMM